jgi:hypothetical protein
MQIRSAEALSLLQVMGRKDDTGAALGELTQDHLDAVGAAGIEAAARFIEEEDFRFQDQSAGESDTLLFATGEGSGAALGKVN